MSKVFVISRRRLKTIGILALLIVLATVYLQWDRAESVSTIPVDERVFHLVTGEFKTTTADGQEIEVYRFDPGTLVIQRGEQVQLNITGINGQSHPFVIEGLNVRGEVKKGETTVVRFKAEHPGTYPILCLTHQNVKQGGPMVGYLIVQ